MAGRIGWTISGILILTIGVLIVTRSGVNDVNFSEDPTWTLSSGVVFAIGLIFGLVGLGIAIGGLLGKLNEPQRVYLPYTLRHFTAPTLPEAVDLLNQWIVENRFRVELDAHRSARVFKDENGAYTVLVWFRPIEYKK